MRVCGVFVGVHGCGHVLGMSLSITLHLIFRGKAQSYLSSLIWLDWLVNELWRATYPQTLVAFMWGLGISTQIIMLTQQTPHPLPMPDSLSKG